MTLREPKYDRLRHDCRRWRILRSKMAATSQPLEGFPPHSTLIEIHLSDPKELFNSLDPTPFHKRDLDPEAEEFIASWARDIPRGVPVGLRVHLDSDVPADPDEVMHAAVRDHFARKAMETQQRLRQLFRVGRISLVIGLAVVAVSVIIGERIETLLQGNRFGSIIRESFLIGGWVAMWRPLEIFLYEWWPIRDEARLFDRLSRMPVRVVKARAG
jgi:hypothetical protein